MAIWWGDEEVLALYPHFPLLSSGFDRPPPRTQFLFDVLWRRKVVSAPGGSFFNHPPWLGRLPEALAPHIWLPFHYTHRELTCVFSGLLNLFMSGPSSLSLSRVPTSTTLCSLDQAHPVSFPLGLMVFSQRGQLLLGLADFCGVLIGRDPSSL